MSRPLVPLILSRITDTETLARWNADIYFRDKQQSLTLSVPTLIFSYSQAEWYSYGLN
jgi:hypothetical protein